MSSINYPIIINGFDISTIPYVQPYSIDYFGNTRTLNIFTLARRNARKVSSAFFQSKVIYISIYIAAPSRALADQSFDTLMSKITSQEGSLIIPQSGTIRQYTATFAKIDKNNTGVGRGIAQPPQGGFADITLEFECSDSYGYDTTSQTIYNLTNQTASSNTYPYTQGGTADTQVPVIQVQLNSVTDASGGSITIGNQATGQAITVSQTWSAHDLLVVDCKNKTCQVNGVDADFSGAFPEFGTGSQTIYVTDTFTARNYRFIAQVQNRYF